VDTLYFDDLVLCPSDTTSDTSGGGGGARMLLAFDSAGTVGDSIKSSHEYVNVFPNPAQNILNLAYKANTTGQVEFELRDELGEPVLKQTLNAGQTSARFNVSNLDGGLYFWILKDSSRIIKSGKVAIIN
jgi:hypothetical protein